jgi:hypothetical protein
MRSHEGIEQSAGSADTTRLQPQAAASGPQALLAIARAVGNRAMATMLEPRGSRTLCRCSGLCTCGGRSGDEDPLPDEAVLRLRGAVLGRPTGRSRVMGRAAVSPRQVSAGGDVLSSARFAGEPLLEACYEDRARLTIGARDSEDFQPVGKVQQALIDLGYDLGPTGADGLYGHLTWNAVKAFKRDHALGWETMGDVGPGTMHRLDALFADDRRYPCDLDTVADEQVASARARAQTSAVTAGAPLMLARATPGAAGSAALPPVTAAPASPVTPGGHVVEIPYRNSVSESLFDVVRWIHPVGQAASDEKAATAVAHVLADPNTQMNVTDDPAFCKNKSGACPVSLHVYDEWARLKGRTKMKVAPGPIESICAELGVAPQSFDAAAKTEKQAGPALEAAQEWLFYGQPGTPLDPQQAGAESRKAREKRMPVRGHAELLENPQFAKLYLTMMKAKIGLGVDESQLHPEEGLTSADIDRVVAGDPRRRYLTELFTQGLQEYKDEGGTDVAGEFVILEASLWDQVLWGNPTAVRNELRIGVGNPERDLGIGLVYKYDNILYYDPQGNPMSSLTGGGYRDPGFKGAAKDPGFLNLDWIADDTLRGFLKLLHDNFKTPTLIIVKGAEAYVNNLDDVNALIRDGLADEIKDELENALKVLIGFLLYRAIAMALLRQPHP